MAHVQYTCQTLCEALSIQSSIRRFSTYSFLYLIMDQSIVALRVKKIQKWNSFYHFFFSCDIQTTHTAVKNFKWILRYTQRNCVEKMSTCFIFNRNKQNSLNRLVWSWNDYLHLKSWYCDITTKVMWSK